MKHDPSRFPDLWPSIVDAGFQASANIKNRCVVQQMSWNIFAWHDRQSSDMMLFIVQAAYATVTSQIVA